MTAKAIIEQCQGLEICEQREVADDYAEVVFLNQQQAQWDQKLVQLLGQPAKPAGKEPSAEDTELTKDFGGVFDDQVLYKKDFGAHKVIAMFWPWQDQTHTTLKIVVLN